MLEDICAALFKLEQWAYLKSSEQEQKNIVQTISSNRHLVARVKQAISDSIGTRKKWTRDQLFTSLQYRTLKISSDKSGDKPHFGRDKELELVRKRLVKVLQSGEILQSWWRTASIQDIFIIDEVPDHLKEEKVTEDNLRVFGNSISEFVLHKFLGYDPLEDSENIVEGTFLTIPRLDAWINTVIDRIGINEIRGGARQKEYGRKFLDFYKKATDQFLGEVVSYVKFWIPQEVEIPSCDPGLEKEAILSMERDGTIVLFSETEQKYFIALTSTWFSKYITKCLGVVHDCFIAEISHDWCSIELFGSEDIKYDPPAYDDQPNDVDNDLVTSIWGDALDTNQNDPAQDDSMGAETETADIQG